MKQTKLPEWAQSIIGQALAEIKTYKDIQIVREKVQGTAVGFESKYLAVFEDLVRAKQKAFKLYK